MMYGGGWSVWISQVTTFPKTRTSSSEGGPDLETETLLRTYISTVTVTIAEDTHMGEEKVRLWVDSNHQPSD